MNHIPRVFGAAVFTFAVALSGCAMMQSAKTAGTSNAMAASQEVPANPSAGSGTVATTLDKATRTLTWTVTYSGLTGPATAGHFHGPAAAGANAGVVVPFTSTASPITGSAVLT